jgi:hypothetical protein
MQKKMKKIIEEATSEILQHVLKKSLKLKNE